MNSDWPMFALFALSNAGTMLLTAWVLHRAKVGASPLPTLPKLFDRKDDEENHESEVTIQKGRPLL